MDYLEYVDQRVVCLQIPCSTYKLNNYYELEQTKFDIMSYDFMTIQFYLK